MKKLILLLTIFSALFLAACDGSSNNNDTAARAGKYLCTEISMDGLTMNPDGKWLQLNADGTATSFLTEEESDAEWRLKGDSFTMSVAGKPVGTGKFQGETLTITLSEIQYTFLREGSANQTSGSGSSYATLTCYGDLYSVRYPTERFHEDPAGMSDLYTEDGTQGWVTRLDSEQRVAEWLASFDGKAVDEAIQDYQTQELTVAGYPARAIIYQNADGWHSEVIVNFGADLGTDTYPMYAAYLYFSGATYLSVWGDDVQAIVNSLTLTN